MINDEAVCNNIVSFIFILSNEATIPSSSSKNLGFYN